MAAEMAPQSSASIARHRVRDQIQELILSGGYPAGAKLRQLHLAEQFGVSQAVVREALLEMQAIGLVRTIDNRGMYVSELNAQKLIEALQVREMLEALAARLCCGRVPHDQANALRIMAERIHDLGRRRHRDQAGVIDRDLHLQLVHLSGNTMLVRLSENYRVLGKVIRSQLEPEAVYAGHLAIIDAIESVQPDSAERAMREHIRAGRETVEREIAAGIFVPHWIKE